MTSEQFQTIKNKIADSKNAISRAEGAIAQLQTQLLQEHGLDSIDAASAHLNKLELDIAADQKKLDHLLHKLEQVTDWGAL